MLVNFIKKEFVLFIFIFLLILLSAWNPSQIINYPFFVDWQTVLALTGLLIITTGIKESGYFSFFSNKLLSRLKTERSLSLFFILFSALLSTFLTNDITLFIVIPLTISLKDKIKNDITKLVIFEAISVNIGSALTPIGNPQNLFLWHKWNISFMKFIVDMFPLVVLLLGILLIFVLIVFPDKEIKFVNNENYYLRGEKTLFKLSAGLLIFYVIFLEIGYADLILLLIVLLFLLFYRRVLLNVDWLLLLLFIIIFIDFHLISNISFIAETMKIFNFHSDKNVFFFSIITSQITSNVPASVFLSKFSHNWHAITYGVNVGGNGLVIASLANIIALRMIKSRHVWIKFHEYSIPYLIISGGIVYILFYFL